MAQSYEENERYKLFTRRTLLLAGGQAAMLSALVGRMYYLQVLEADRYRTLAEENRINIKLLAPPRGRILDRFGVPLAANDQDFRVMLVRERTEDLDETLAALGRVIHLSDGDRERVLREAKRKRAFVPITVKANLSWEEVARVEVNSPELPGISIEVGEIRDYPYGRSLSHVLGYVAAVSEKELQTIGDPLLELPGFRIGKNGIEREYDQILRGAAGTSQVEINAYGRVIRELSRNEGDPGQELVLTLDAGLQSFVHQRLLSEDSAAAVVLDIETGDVLALSSVPSYDPEAFSIGISSKDWNALINDPLHPLTNKSINGTFAPGSTFKMLVALAAMEAGVKPDHEVYCPGFMTLGRSRFHCWKKHGHGKLDMIGGIQHSCDVYFYDLARRAGIDNISEMAFRFGLGNEVGIDLPNERSGTIPTRDWKLANIGEPWQGGETLVTAIGQGYVLATPLQLAVMAARLASGLKVVPRLSRGVHGVPSQEPEAPPPAFEPLGVDPERLKVIHKAMDMVSNHPRGTAYRYRIEEEGHELAGKTGTSQVRRITLAERAAGVSKNEDLPWRYRDHGLFVCFAPVEKPRYACAIVVEHGGGSKAAAPIARDIMIETQRRDPSIRPGVPLAAIGKPSDRG
ncbi:MAG TPA: penicillin-binding protein 2 [Kiloniellaceae bacterium]|nr:penicillin-binding protein 2 [Kiloniellaceae bacterium]